MKSKENELQLTSRELEAANTALEGVQAQHKAVSSSYEFAQI